MVAMYQHPKAIRIFGALNQSHALYNVGQRKAVITPHARPSDLYRLAITS